MGNELTRGRLAGKAAATALALALGLFGVAAGGMAAQPAYAATGAAAATDATISATNLATSGNYNAYQILVGSVTSETAGSEGGSTGKIGDAEVNTATYAVVKSTINTFNTANSLTAITWPDDTTGTAVDKANAVMDAIAAINTAGKSQDFANDLAAALEASGVTPTKTATASSGSADFAGIKTGYYLICADSDNAGLAKNEAMTSAILTVLDSDGTSITGKVKVPTITKQVKDNGTFDAMFQEVADAQLKDSAIDMATYKIVGTMPANIDEFDAYTYSFVDQLPTGMKTTAADLANWKDANGNGITIKVGNKDVTSSFTASVKDIDVDEDGTNDTSVITWKCDNVKGIDGLTVTSNTEFALEYTPVLSDDTTTTYYNTLSTLANPQVNSAHLTYETNPYSQGTGDTGSHTNDTPDDESKLYSYNLEIDKVDNSTPAAALSGAVFTLTDANGNTIGKEITTDSNGKFEFTGLESEVAYTITETTVPSGYKAISPITFTISATKADDGDTITAISVAENSDPSAAATIVVDTSNTATVKATIVNLPGVNMPGTGQAGVVALVVAGGVLLVVSCIAVARKKRNQDGTQA